jgi:nucleotide-binding universal stress UspA family protein
MKVLYATDGFPAAGAAGNLLKSLFSRDGVEVTVATVTHSGSLDPDHVLLELDPIEARRNQSDEIATAAANDLAAAGFTVSKMILEGKPGHELVEAASHGGFDVIVVGEGGPPSLGRRLLGSVSTHVFRHATCAVLVVPPDAE